MDSIEVFLLGEKAAPGEQEGKCCDAHGRVMVEPPPSTPFEVVEPELAFQHVISRSMRHPQ